MWKSIVLIFHGAQLERLETKFKWICETKVSPNLFFIYIVYISILRVLFHISINNMMTDMLKIFRHKPDFRTVIQ